MLRTFPSIHLPMHPSSSIRYLAHLKAFHGGGVEVQRRKRVGNPLVGGQFRVAPLYECTTTPKGEENNVATETNERANEEIDTFMYETMQRSFERC